MALRRLPVLVSLPVVVCSAALALAGCPAKVASVEIAPPKVAIKSDADVKALTATAKDKDGAPIEGKIATWTSSDPAVAVVDSEGKVKPAGSGAAKITAKIDEVSGTADVEVALLKSVKLESAALVIKVGAPNPPIRMALMNEKGEPIEVKDAKIEWKSADPNIATVGADGSVTGVSVGGTTISCKVNELPAENIIVTVNPSETAAAVDAGPAPK